VPLVPMSECSAPCSELAARLASAELRAAKRLPAAEVEAERLLVSCALRDAVRYLVGWGYGYGQYMAGTAVPPVAARLGKA